MRVVIALLTALLLGACAGATADTTAPSTAPSTVTPVTAQPGSTTLPDPEAPIAEPAKPPAVTGPFFYDHADLNIMESYPIQVSVTVFGATPTPCDTPGWRIEQAADEIRVEMYTIPLNDPATSCVAALEDVSVTVPLGSFTEGAFDVYVDGDLVGSFEA